MRACERAAAPSMQARNVRVCTLHRGGSSVYSSQAYYCDGGGG
jgi:hypothetical protein